MRRLVAGENRKTVKGQTYGKIRQALSEVDARADGCGGAGTPRHLIEVFTRGQADAAIIASMIHTGEYTIRRIKDELAAAGVAIWKKW